MLKKTLRTDESKKTESLIENCTKDELKEIAKRMIEPIRCGGMTYEKGKPYIWFGGIAYPYKELNKAYKANRYHFPTEWCARWQKENGK